MAEVLFEFQTSVCAGDGSLYRARACGGEAGDGTGRWQGWIEFVPADGGPTIRTQRETTQPNRTDTAYWATGLTPSYLEGALQRALNPTLIPVRRSTQATPAFEAPAPDFAGPADASSAGVPKSARGAPSVGSFDHR